MLKLRHQDSIRSGHEDRDMARYLFILLAALTAIAGCMMSDGPIDSIEFDHIRSIDQLVGYYRNRGDSGSAEKDVYLSELLWMDRDLDHPAIALIEVTKDGPGALRVTAHRVGSSVHSDVFVLGEDFKIEKGRIKLESDLEFVSSEAVIAVTSQRGWLGLESSGHAAYRESERVGGLVFLVVPVAGTSRADVRFEHANSREALLFMEGGETFPIYKTTGAVYNSELEREIFYCIALFEGDNEREKQQSLAALAWSGISDRRLYDLMEAKLLRLLKAQKKLNTPAPLATLIEGLSYSGQARYRQALQRVAFDAEQPSLRRQAELALQRLERYSLWNPIIVAGADDALKGRLSELRISNMIRSTVPQLRLMGAREANRNYLRNHQLIEAANVSVLREFNRNLEQPDQIASTLELMKVVAGSGDVGYLGSFEKIAEASGNHRIINAAWASIRQLQSRESPQFVDIDALLPVVNAMTGAGGSVDLVVDGREFSYGIRSVSTPSLEMTEPRPTPEEKIGLIAVLPGSAGHRLTPYSLFSLPVGSTVTSEVARLLEAALNRRPAKSDNQPLLLSATIDQFWGWWETDSWPNSMHAQIIVRLLLSGAGEDRKFTVHGSGKQDGQRLTGNQWRTTYELAYRDFLRNMDAKLEQLSL